MNIKKWFERSSKAVKETAQTIKDTYVLPKDATDTRRHDEVKAKKLVSLALGEDNDVERFIGLTE